MDIEVLRCFIAVVETGSYSLASKQVHRTQSAVSQKIKKLNNDMPKTLLHKSGQNLELTDDGKVFLAYARHIVSLYDDAIGQILDSQSIARPLKIGCPDMYVEHILPTIIKKIQSLIPNLPIQVSSGNSTMLREKIALDELDIAIVSRSSEKTAGQFLKRVYGQWAFNGDFRALSHHYIKTGLIPLVLFNEDCDFHQSAIQGLSQRNVTNKVVCIADTLTAINSLVMSGQGITVIADCNFKQMTALTNDISPYPFKLPNLPEVTVEMIMSTNTHPNISRAQLIKVCDDYCHQ